MNLKRVESCSGPRNGLAQNVGGRYDLRRGFVLRRLELLVGTIRFYHLLHHSSGYVCARLEARLYMQRASDMWHAVANAITLRARSDSNLVTAVQALFV